MDRLLENKVYAFGVNQYFNVPPIKPKYTPLRDLLTLFSGPTQLHDNLINRAYWTTFKALSKRVVSSYFSIA